MSPHHYLFAFKNADLGTKLGLLPDVFLINLRRYRGDPLLDDPETHLPAIDRLGGVHSGGSCLYRRVLVPAQARGTVLPVRL